MEKLEFNIQEVSNMLDISIPRLLIWEKNNRLIPDKINNKGEKLYLKSQLESYDSCSKLFNSKWDEELRIKPLRTYSSIELFAGAGGLALGFEKAGIEAKLLNEIDKSSCETLRLNRPEWNVIEDDVVNIDFNVLNS